MAVHLRQAFAVLLVVSLGWAVAQDTEPVHGGSLVIGVFGEAIGMDPNLVTAHLSLRRIELLYNRLVRYNPQLEIVPDLAVSWEIPDPMTYIFHLREGVTFHNGRELTAEDVKYTIERILDPATGSPARSWVEMIEEVVVHGPYTVEFRLSAPAAGLLAALAHANTSIVPREEVEAHGNLQRHIVGTGPFMLESWTPDQEMVLVRNPNYFEAGLPYLDQITIRVIPEQASLLAGLRAGSLHAALLIEGGVLHLAKRDPNIEVLLTPALTLRTYGFNTTREPFDDARVRRAIALAIDREEIIQLAELGFGQVSAPMPSSAVKWAVPVAELPTYRRDLEQARALLREADVPEGFTFNILTSPAHGLLPVAEVIQDQLRQIGLDPQLEVVEWGIYIDRWVKRDFDSIVEIRGGPADPDGFLYRMIHSEGAVNNFLYSNDELDALLEAGRHSINPEERRAIYRQVQEIIASEAPFISLYTPAQTMAIRQGLHGFRVVPDGAFHYFGQAWLEP